MRVPVCVNLLFHVCVIVCRLCVHQLKTDTELVRDEPLS